MMYKMGSHPSSEEKISEGSNDIFEQSVTTQGVTQRRRSSVRTLEPTMAHGGDDDQPISGLMVGSCAAQLPFSLDEDDPLLFAVDDKQNRRNSNSDDNQNRRNSNSDELSSQSSGSSIGLKSDMDISEYNDDVSFVNDSEEEDSIKNAEMLITQLENSEQPSQSICHDSNNFSGNVESSRQGVAERNANEQDQKESEIDDFIDRSPNTCTSISEDHQAVTDEEADRQFEKNYLGKIELSILKAEEREMIQRYERSIKEQEEKCRKIAEEENRINQQLARDEKEMLDRYEKSISAVEEKKREEKRLQEKKNELREKRKQLKQVIQEATIKKRHLDDSELFPHNQNRDGQQVNHLRQESIANNMSPEEKARAEYERRKRIQQETMEKRRREKTRQDELLVQRQSKLNNPRRDLSLEQKDQENEIGKDIRQGCGNSLPGSHIRMRNDPQKRQSVENKDMDVQDGTRTRFRQDHHEQIQQSHLDKTTTREDVPMRSMSELNYQIGNRLPSTNHPRNQRLLESPHVTTKLVNTSDDKNKSREDNQDRRRQAVFYVEAQNRLESAIATLPKWKKRNNQQEFQSSATATTSCPLPALHLADNDGPVHQFNLHREQKQVNEVDRNHEPPDFDRNRQIDALGFNQKKPSTDTSGNRGLMLQPHQQQEQQLPLQSQNEHQVMSSRSIPDNSVVRIERDPVEVKTLTAEDDLTWETWSDVEDLIFLTKPNNVYEREEQGNTRRERQQLRRFLIASPSAQADLSNANCCSPCCNELEVGIELVEATKIVPRYLDLDREFLNHKILLNDFFQNCKKSRQTTLLTMTVRNYNSNSLLIEFIGSKHEVEAALIDLREWMKRRIQLYNFQRIVEKGVQKDIVLDAKKPIFASLTHCQRDHEHSGLFINSQHGDPSRSQLVQAIGLEAATNGAIVQSVNKKTSEFLTIDKFKEIKANAARRNEPLRLQVMLALPPNAANQVSDSILRDKAVGALKNRKCKDTKPSSAKRATSSPKIDNCRTLSLQQLGSVPEAMVVESEDQVIAEPNATIATYSVLDYSCRHFKAKFKDIISKEFADTPISATVALGSMWKRHQLRFNDCSDNCLCYLELSYLTEEIVADYSLNCDPDFSKNAKLIDNKYFRGVVSNFANTYVPDVAKTFPGEKSDRILQRLSKMWLVHTKQKGYGQKCVKGCLCRKGWVNVFHEGRVFKGEKDIAIQPTINRSAGRMTLDVKNKKRIASEISSDEYQDQRTSLPRSSATSRTESAVRSWNCQKKPGEQQCLSDATQGYECGRDLPSKEDNVQNENQKNNENREPRILKKNRQEKQGKTPQPLIKKQKMQVGSVTESGPGQRNQIGDLAHGLKENPSTSTMKNPHQASSQPPQQLEQSRETAGIRQKPPVPSLPRWKKPQKQHPPEQLEQPLQTEEICQKSPLVNLPRSKKGPNPHPPQQLEQSRQTADIRQKPPLANLPQLNGRENPQESRSSGTTSLPNMPPKLYCNGEKIQLPRKTIRRNSETTSRGSELCTPNTNGFAEYVVTFSSLKALGFFCVGSRDESGAFCRIYSLSPVAQLADELRLQVGTRILSVRVGDSGEWKQVASPIDLKETFEDARLKSLDISIKCVNTNVTKSLMDMAFQRRNKEWSMTGQWHEIGNGISGWDGGASLIDPSCAPQRQVMSVNSQHPRTQSSNVPPNVLSPIADSDDHLWVLLDKPRQLVTTNAQSIMQMADKRPKMDRSRSRVRFTPDNENRKYVIDSLSYEFLVLSKQIGDADDEKISEPCGDKVSSVCEDKVSSSGRDKVSSDYLMQIIRHHSWKDVLKLLREYAVETRSWSDNFQRAHAEVKSKLDEINRSILTSPNDVGLKNQEHDLKNKEVILKVYINAHEVIMRSNALKNWERYRIVVEKIEDFELNLSPIQPGTLLTGKVSRFSAIGQVTLESPFPTKLFDSVVDYTDVYHAYDVSHNPSLTPDRSLQISLSIVQDVETTKIGDLKIRMSRLRQKCLYSIEGVDMIVDNPSAGHIKKVRLKVHTSRIDPSNDIREKRRDLCIMLGEIYKWIKRFNESNISKDSSDKLSFTTDIRVADDLSLLHAAIWLKEPPLVELLLELGANPLAKSKIGSPLSLIQHMMDGNRRMNPNIGSSDNDDDDPNEDIDGDNLPSINPTLTTEVRQLQNDGTFDITGSGGELWKMLNIIQNSISTSNRNHP